MFLQHPGSDVDVWQGKPRGQGRASLVSAASAQNFLLRVRDVTAVLDQLGRWQSASGHELSGRLDMTRIGMSGHSFGAITTQAVSGQTFQAGIIAADSRIKAALPMSPSTPQRGSASSAFAAVKIPWLVMTGTLDSSPIGNASAASRREVFAALPPPSKYELVLDGAEHSAFTDRALPGDKATRNPNHHRAILALSTAFWDAYLRVTAPPNVARRRWSAHGARAAGFVGSKIAAGSSLLAVALFTGWPLFSREPRAASGCEPRAPNYRTVSRTTQLPNYRDPELPNYNPPCPRRVLRDAPKDSSRWVMKNSHGFRGSARRISQMEEDLHRSAGRTPGRMKGRGFDERGKHSVALIKFSPSAYDPPRSARCDQPSGRRSVSNPCHPCRSVFKPMSSAAQPMQNNLRPLTQPSLRGVFGP